MFDEEKSGIGKKVNRLNKHTCSVGNGEVVKTK